MRFNILASHTSAFCTGIVTCSSVRRNDGEEGFIVWLLKYLDFMQVKKMRIVHLLIGLLLMHTQLCAQDAKTEIAKLTQYLQSPAVKHVSGTMHLIRLSDNKKMDVVDFSYWLKDTLLSVTMNYLEIFKNQQYYVYVNNQNKSIYIRESKTINRPKEASQDFLQILSLMKQPGAQATVSSNNGQMHLKINMPKGSKFGQLDIVYSPDTYQILSAEASVLKPNTTEVAQKLKINYTHHTATEAEAKNHFSETRFFRMVNKKIVLDTKYFNYTRI
jgi:hypothetical protein